MYHRAQAGPYGNPPAMLDAHFAYLARHCRCVLPGEPLADSRVKVCLIFDDAYFDFYSVVFPLLEKHNLRSMLAVSPGLVHEQAVFSNTTRTHTGGAVGLTQGYDDGYCTWGELATLAASGRVAIAAHGYNHAPLDCQEIDLDTEIKLPQVMLSARLGQRVDSFVFPYGRFSAPAVRKVREHYRYAFRIGGAANRDWSGSLLYRVDGDRMASPDALFKPARLAVFRARYHWNRLRGR